MQWIAEKLYGTNTEELERRRLDTETRIQSRRDGRRRAEDSARREVDKRVRQELGYATEEQWLRSLGIGGGDE